MKRLVTVALTVLIWSDPARAVDRYVVPNGSTSGNCTDATPCTIQRAADIANPGDVVLVGDGIYTTTPSTYLLTIRRGGTPTSRITFKAVNKWGAKFWGRGDTSLYGVRVEANYVTLEGFDIYEFREIGVYNVSGAFFELIGNHIHHIGRNFCSNDVVGKDGYYSQGVSDVRIEANVFNDIGRRLLGEGGCGTSLPHNDHGLYMSGSRINVYNNIFYNIRSGWPVHFYPSPSSNCKIYGNVFAGYIQDGSSRGQIIIWPACTNMDIKNNIFYQTRGHLIHMGNSTTTGEVYNNLTDVAVAGIFDVAQTGFRTGGNIFTTDPSFMDVTSSGGVLGGSPDFHLVAGSRAIDAGLVLAEVGADFDGNRRPQGVGQDVGPYEFVLGPEDLIPPAAIVDLVANPSP